jgi:CspA family cold shock protein
MATGTVKWFNPTKGFGFIQPQGGGKDVFVHITAVQAAGLNGLDENQKVSYDVVSERGKEAASNGSSTTAKMARLSGTCSLFPRCTMRAAPCAISSATNSISPSVCPTGSST